MEENEKTIDLYDLFRYLRRKLPVILAVTLLLGAAVFVGKKVFTTPQYQATVNFYINNGESSAEYRFAQQTVLDCNVLIKSRNITGEIIKKLGLDMTEKQLAEKIKVEALDETRVVTVSATDPDPQRAADIANCASEQVFDLMKEIMRIDTVAMVNEAVPPTSPVGAGALKSAVAAMLLAGVLTVGVFCIIRVRDNSIRTEEDVERLLGLSVLGAVPVDENMEKAKGKKKRKYFVSLLTGKK